LRPPAGHATNAHVTTETGGSGAAAGAGDFASRWHGLRADGDIQFTPLSVPEQQPPQWWVDFLEWLAKVLKPIGDALASLGDLIGLSGRAMLWLLAAVAVVLVALLVWRAVGDVRRRRATSAESVPEWAPGADEALALLEDADRLAAEGRYAEATHLLLKRSVGQIAAARPGLLEPSSTAREIARLPALSDKARTAFGAIAERVEQSLFALRGLTHDDWQAARAAYAEFALAGPQAS
jgi:hypothetical protein